MVIIPAIDIKDGRCVRLKQGDMTEETVFSEDPVGVAQHWLAQGARRLHIVDLNGAVAGKPRNEAVIRKIVDAVGEEIPVQLGGGIRDLDTVEGYIDAGVTYVVIGTAAVKNPGFLQDACAAFAGLRIRDVHELGGLEFRPDGYVEQAALSFGVDFGHAGKRLRQGAVLIKDTKPASAFRHQHAPVGKKCDPPGPLKA